MRTLSHLLEEVPRDVVVWPAPTSTQRVSSFATGITRTTVTATQMSRGRARSSDAGNATFLPEDFPDPLVLRRSVDSILHAVAMQQ